MRISQSSSDLYTSKAQQAWEARRAAKVEIPNSPPAAPSTTVRKSGPADQTPVPRRADTGLQPGVSPGIAPEISTEAQRTSASPVSGQWAASQSANQWEGTVRDIQRVAARAGFVDVSEQAIRRAYLQGESLLADYHV